MLWEVLLLVLAVPIGFLIAWLARDELLIGRKWFIVLLVVSCVGGAIFGYYGMTSSIWASGFVFIIASISLWKSYDKSWIRS